MNSETERNMSSNNEPLLTRQQAAEYLNVPVSTLASWHSRGPVRPPSIRLGGLVRYKKSDLDAFVNACKKI